MIALRITLTFAVVSALWIFFSDQLLGIVVHDPQQMADVSTVKGWFYVLVVSTLLYVLVRNSVRELDAAHRKLLLFEFTVERANDMVLWIDPSDRLLYANHSAARQLGYPVEALKTMRMRDLDVGASDEDVNSIWTRLREAKSLQLRRDLKTAQGVLLPVELRVDLIEYQGQSFACASLVDLTERLRSEEQLRQAQKLESIGTLAAGVAHDFNNILTVIQGCSELLTLSAGDAARSRSLVSKIQAAVQRASHLVKELLVFGRKESLHLGLTSFNTVVERSAGFLGGVVGPRVATSLSLCDQPTPVEVDAEQWERVILNLAVNARDAMEGEGTLTLTTKVVGHEVVLTVRDTGLGIPAEVQRRIFEPFFTTKETGGGTGLGLSIVHGIVSQHHGTIRVDSPPPGEAVGTEFTIRLPLVSETAPALISG